ncbi:DUF2178 domain-containing protein [Clostridium botulinum]|nr:DUF2178 domain-containing protein [Clostridium botulinum]
MKGRRLIFSVNSIVGIILVLLGIFVFKDSQQDTIKKLCFAVGSICTTLGIGSLIHEWIVSITEYDDIKKIKDIELKDERNTQIREKSAYRVCRIMSHLFCAYTLFLIFMKADLIFIIPSVGLVMVQLILIIYYSNYYSKIM